MMTTVRVSLCLAVLGLACWGCVEEEAAFETSERPVIYGQDNRIEVFQASAALQNASDAVVVLVPASATEILPDGRHLIETPTTFGESFDLCSDEPFASQPDPGYCTGALVAADIIVTAGHCIDEVSCPATDLVFGFEMLDATTPRTVVDDNDVYRCMEIVARQETATDDWAVIRVDRPVLGHTPLPVRESGTIALGAPVVLMGHPGGIPLKIAAGATVRSNSHANYFQANLDAYGGNSGSPVINAATLALEGLLVRGNQDFVRVRRGGRRCYVSNVCPDTGCKKSGWEEVSRATRFEAHIAAICAADDPFERNDTRTTPMVPITPGIYVGLHACPADPDWYGVDLVAGQTITATVDFVHADGDLNVELWSGNALVAQSAGTTDREVVTFTAAAPGRVFVGVLGVARAANDYDLTVEVTP